MQKLSIIIPVFNEVRTIAAVAEAVAAANPPGLSEEIIIVDDGSTDGTRDVLKGFERKNSFRVIYHDRNRGKGGAVRTGLREASGDYLIIQDADLEYSPADYPLLLEPLTMGKASVVYGSRFFGGRPHRVLFYWHYLGNRFLTTLSNVFTNLNLTDVETGYKAFTKSAAHTILPRLTADDFGIEIELTAEVARAHLPLYEVGISYAGRTYAEGKKIGWRDGVAALWYIVKFNVLR